jgi:hypothetical protein
MGVSAHHWGAGIFRAASAMSRFVGTISLKHISEGNTASRKMFVTDDAHDPTHLHKPVVPAKAGTQ